MRDECFRGERRACLDSQRIVLNWNYLRYTKEHTNLKLSKTFHFTIKLVKYRSTRD